MKVKIPVVIIRQSYKIYNCDKILVKIDYNYETVVAKNY